MWNVWSILGPTCTAGEKSSKKAASLWSGTWSITVFTWAADMSVPGTLENSASCLTVSCGKAAICTGAHASRVQKDEVHTLVGGVTMTALYRWEVAIEHLNVSQGEKVSESSQVLLQPVAIVVCVQAAAGIYRGLIDLIDWSSQWRKWRALNYIS